MSQGGDETSKSFLKHIVLVYIRNFEQKNERLENNARYLCGVRHLLRSVFCASCFLNRRQCFRHL